MWINIIDEETIKANKIFLPNGLILCENGLVINEDESTLYDDLEDKSLILGWEWNINETED
jgi:hypothetical protein